MNRFNNRHSRHKKYRVLYCEGNIDGTIGGSYFSLFYLVTGLDHSLFHPIVVFGQENDMIPKFQAAGIETRVARKLLPFAFKRPGERSSQAYRLIYPALRLAQKAINFWRQIPLAGLICARFLIRKNIDLVHLNNSITSNHEWMLGAFLSRTRCITHERGINASYNLLARFFAKRLDAVICISNAVQTSLESQSVRTRRTVTIYNGIEPTVLVAKTAAEKIRETQGVAPNSNLIGVVGNIKEWKGQETAIRAMPKIISAFPDSVCLFLGDVSKSDKDYEHKLHDLVSSLGLESNIIFAGYTKDVASYLAAFDIVIHTSIRPEPFGRVLIEAMAMKRPLVGANAGAVPEIIVPGQTGLLFEPGDAESLASAVIRILANREETKTMVIGAFERLSEKFHIDKNISETQGLYQKILPKPVKI